MGYIVIIFLLCNFKFQIKGAVSKFILTRDKMNSDNIRTWDYSDSLVACRSQYLSLAGFSDAAKQDASCTLLPSPLYPGHPLTLPSPVSPVSFLSPLSLHLSLSPINKIAHLPRKLIVRLNFSDYYRQYFFIHRQLFVFTLSLCTVDLQI